MFTHRLCKHFPLPLLSEQTVSENKNKLKTFESTDTTKCDFYNPLEINFHLFS